MNKKSYMNTLRRAKSNGTIHFLLSLKLAAPEIFQWKNGLKTKTYIFCATRFFHGLEKNLHKQKQFLEWLSSCFVRTFFSKLYNKKIEFKSQ